MCNFSSPVGPHRGPLGRREVKPKWRVKPPEKDRVQIVGAPDEPQK